MPVDIDVAFKQHVDYVDLLAAEGLTPLVAPDLSECPDASFVEDTVTVIGTICVLTAPGVPSRQPEVASVRQVLNDGRWTTESVRNPATLDGGDVLVTDRHVFVGMSTRTNKDAVVQLAPLARREGREAFGMPVRRTLHLKTGVTALPDGSLIQFDSMDSTPFVELGYRVIVTDEPTGANVLSLNDLVIVAASAPRTAELLTREGYRVQQLDISEFEKLEAGLTCLSVLLPNPASLNP